MQIKGLYPCGKGAYTGGIISAAIDDEKCAEQIGLKVRAKGQR